ncbi:MAG: hypothetical protein FJX67_11555 [Alphaproteobacteria bacterium]|nr:hypothetical protein [Alphaproteobacteria bacterium]
MTLPVPIDTMGGGEAPIAHIGPREVENAVDRAVVRYIADRHARVDAFVDRTFSFRGALRLHKAAIGWDLLRAPANVALAAPSLALRLATTASRRAQWEEATRFLSGQRLFFTTDVGRELEWRLVVDLLELPYVQPRRRSEHDALAVLILDDPVIRPAIVETMAAIRSRAADPGFRDWLADSLAQYAATRIAAADLATSLVATATGGVAFQSLTPGLVSLAPLVARALAQKIVATSVPLGAGVVGFWSAGATKTGAATLALGMTGGMMAVATVLVAFAGVVTDPIQRRLGVHDARLHRLIDCLAAALRGEDGAQFVVRDVYVARVLDLIDVLRAARTLAGGH